MRVRREKSLMVGWATEGLFPLRLEWSVATDGVNGTKQGIRDRTWVCELVEVSAAVDDRNRDSYR